MDFDTLNSARILLQASNITHNHFTGFTQQFNIGNITPVISITDKTNLSFSDIHYLAPFARFLWSLYKNLDKDEKLSKENLFNAVSTLTNVK